MPPVRSEASAEATAEQPVEKSNEHANEKIECISVESPVGENLAYHPILAAKCVFLAVD